jgi:hypothetical protein
LILTEVPGVERSKSLNKVAKKNDYVFGFSKEFVNQVVCEVCTLHRKPSV